MPGQPSTMTATPPVAGTAPSNGEGDRLPSVSEAVERVGYGPAQLLAGFLGGGVYLAGGATLLLAGALSDPIGKTFQLRAWERAWLMSAIFIGMLCGNSSSGPLGDSLGRRIVIVASLGLTFAAGLVCAFATSFSMLLFARHLLGLAMGLGIVPWVVLSTEITPAAYRVGANAYSQVWFVAGELYVAVIILCLDPNMRHLEWRSLTLVGIGPVLVMAVLAYMFLVQSPAYLATKGQHEQAREVIATMARQNGAPQVATAFRQDAVVVDNSTSSSVVYDAIFGKRMLFSTLVVMYSCFVLNLVFYGVLYGLPQVAESMDTGTTAAIAVVLGCLWELPGLAMGAYFGTRFRRLPLISACYAGIAGALMCFGIGVASSHLWFSHYIIQGSLLVIKMLSNTAFVVVYQYASEIYPAVARTTGSAICVSGGRLGAILAPVIFEEMADYTGSFSGFFLCAAGFSALMSFAALLLPFETAGKNLDDDEMEPVLAKQKSLSGAHKVAMP